jgi:hypothetical protein
MSLNLTTTATILGLAKRPGVFEDEYGRMVLSLNIEINGSQYELYLVTKPGQSIQQALEYLAEVGYLTKNNEKFLLQIPPWILDKAPWVVGRVKGNVMVVYIDDYEQLKRVTTLIENILRRGSVEVNCRPCGGCCGRRRSLRVSPVEYFALERLREMLGYRSLCKVLRDLSNLFCSKHKRGRGDVGYNRHTNPNLTQNPPHLADGEQPHDQVER